MVSYRIFTIDGAVDNGVLVQSLALKGANIEIPAIIVGEQGRGRNRGVLPVAGAEVGDILHFASLSKTRADKPRLIAATGAMAPEALVVFRSQIGFRGSNSHTGDRDGTPLNEFGQYSFLPFPGRVLVTGVIAQGDAGRAGSGTQIVALVPKNIVFRVGFGGRRYSAPSAYYYYWNGTVIQRMTWEEREVADLW
jgi:hypothetical protein